VHTLSGRI